MKKVVLYAEHNRDDLFLLRHFLEKAAPQIDLRDVSTAMALFDWLSKAAQPEHAEEYPMPTAIILEPRISGFDKLVMLQWIRENPLIKNIPVIVFTDSKGEDYQAEAERLGVSAYFDKGVGFDALLSALLPLL